MDRTQIRRGLFTNDNSLILSGFQRLWEEIKITSQHSDDIQHDNSFHQHGPELLAGSYGEVYSQLLTAIVVQTANLTTYLPSTDKLKILSDYLLDGQAWMIRGRLWDVAVVGRGFTRPQANGPTVGLSPSTLRALPTARKAEMEAFADRLDQKPSAPRLSGHKHYWDSDYSVFRKAEFLASLKMYSTRTIPARCVNEEAKLSEVMVSAMLVI